MMRLVPRASLTRQAIVLVALLALQGCAQGGASGSPSPTDAPIVTPSAAPTVLPTTVPTNPPASQSPDGSVTVDLANLTGHAVTAVIKDQTATLAAASSGQPGDGMSVRWHDSIVENVDATTLRLVWVGLPLDDQVQVSITGSADSLQLRLVQKGPVANSDAVGYDRILLLEFKQPVRSESVTTTIEDSSPS